MTITWSRHALGDRSLILEFIAAENPIAAVEVDERIHSAVDQLTAFPERGRPGRVSQTRELVVPRTPYIIAYSTGNEIRILRILHGAQLWPEAL